MMARRGRPKGSISLTPEKIDLLLTALRAGSLLSDAAELIECSPRTIRELIQRGEGRSSRPSSPKLAKFAKDVRAASAQARVGAAARAHEANPTWWLLRAARSTADREGWTEPPASAGEEITDEEAREELKHLLGMRLAQDPQATVPACSKPRCGCEFHHRRSR